MERWNAHAHPDIPYVRVRQKARNSRYTYWHNGLPVQGVLVSLAPGPYKPLTPFSTLTPGSACKKCQMPLVGVAPRGAPWHRVLGASGKVSLPAAAGGDTQRRLLREEGVIFRENGAVAPGTFGERVAPFFQ